MSIISKSRTKQVTNSIIRITKTVELDEIVKNIKNDYPILNETEIIKMLISEGYQVKLSLKLKKSKTMIEILEEREKNGQFITGLSEDEQYKLLKENDLI